MFPAQRIDKLKKILMLNKTITISTLCEELAVSSVTVRKYLDDLEDQGFLKKFHGGAMLVEADTDLMPSLQSVDPSKNIANLEHISALAATLVEDNDTIFLGHGPICTALAGRLSARAGLSVLTNNINAVPMLRACAKNLVFIGGEISSQDNSFFTCGNSTLAQLDGIFIQKAFYSVDGIDMLAGLTVNNFELCKSLCKINSITKETIILAESNQFDKICMHHVQNIHPDCTFISDREIDSKYAAFFFEHNIKILTSCAL